MSIRTTAILIMILNCSLLALAGDGGDGSIKDKQSIEKAVLEVHNQMAQANRDLNSEKMFEYILDAGPGVIISDGNLMKSREEALNSVKNGFQLISKVERTFNQTYVTVLSSDAALVTSEGISGITLKDGRTFSNTFALTEVFVLKDGKWKMIHGHYSMPNAQ